MAGRLQIVTVLIGVQLDATICVVCMQEQRSCVIMPCAHLVTCTACSDRLTSCPICRGEIERKINTHG